MPAGINLWTLVGLVGTMLWTNVVMALLKKWLPDWDAKAWAPPLIGAVSSLLGALAAGQIQSVESLLVWVLAGLGAGTTASSVRDVVKGK